VIRRVLARESSAMTTMMPKVTMGYGVLQCATTDGVCRVMCSRGRLRLAAEGSTLRCNMRPSRGPLKDVGDDDVSFSFFLFFGALFSIRHYAIQVLQVEYVLALAYMMRERWGRGGRLAGGLRRRLVVALARVSTRAIS
jgi:hypothetical protein